MGIVVFGTRLEYEGNSFTAFLSALQPYIHAASQNPLYDKQFRPQESGRCIPAFRRISLRNVMRTDDL